jgi:hypothetical protein
MKKWTQIGGDNKFSYPLGVGYFGVLNSNEFILSSLGGSPVGQSPFIGLKHILVIIIDWVWAKTMFEIENLIS